MKTLIFGGTTEGRELAAKLSSSGIDVTLSVATNFGADIAASYSEIAANVKIATGRMGKDEMVECIKQSAFDYVIDATHPYATIVTENIQSACKAAKANYMRLLRKESEVQHDVIQCADIEAAVEVLKESNDKALLTIGSKELEHFTHVNDYAERFYPRILPMEDSLANAVRLGYRGSNIICMQGPYDVDMNVATLKMTGAKYLVTKDSGDVGGVEEKITAAVSLGCKVIIISRPTTEEGLSFEDILECFGIKNEHNGQNTQPNHPSQSNEQPRIDDKVTCDALDSNDKIAAKPNDANTDDSAFFPLFVDMANKKVLVIGAGTIAERRIKILNAFGADITVIAPVASDEIKSAAKLGELTYLERRYISGDIAKVKPFLVLTATDDRQTNHEAMLEAESLSILISVADYKEECSFYFPAIIENRNYIMGLVSKDGNHSGVRQLAEEIREWLKK